MAPAYLAILICLGAAVLIAIPCMILDRIGNIVYVSTTFLWYLVAGLLVLASILVFLYHVSGLQISIK